MLAVSAEYRLQLVPNWNGITMPDTTPMPKATEKIFTQNEEIRNSTARPAIICAPSITAMNEASPIVTAGSRMCQPITQTNCRRERISGSSIIGTASSACGQIGGFGRGRGRCQHPGADPAVDRGSGRVLRYEVRVAVLLYQCGDTVQREVPGDLQ